MQNELTAERIEAAIAVLEKRFNKSCGDYRYQNAEKLDFEDALWDAIAALRAEQERLSICQKCTGFAYVQTPSGKIIPAECPCGRRLTEGREERERK